MRSGELQRRYRDRFEVSILVPNDSDMAIVDRIIFDELVRRGLRPDGVASMAAARRPVARNELLNWLSRNQKKSAIWAKSDSLLPKTSKHGGFCK
jgi:hypothetical protein